MIDFIIYEKNPKLKSIYEMIILNFLGCREEEFKIYSYENNIKRKCKRKIYIISSEDLEEAIRIAKEIRETGDWYSKIIMIGEFKNPYKKILKSKLLVLDYIDKNDTIKERLKETLFLAYSILSREKTLNFIQNNEINKIPYDNILYIEKDNNQNHCTIYTTDNTYIIKDTINNLEEQLDSAYFMKTHRSCIVNIHNIKNYNCTTNIIYFENNKIDLISREKRQILKSRLMIEKITN